MPRWNSNLIPKAILLYILIRVFIRMRGYILGYLQALVFFRLSCTIIFRILQYLCLFDNFYMTGNDITEHLQILLKLVKDKGLKVNKKKKSIYVKRDQLLEVTDRTKKVLDFNQKKNKGYQRCPQTRK